MNPAIRNRVAAALLAVSAGGLGFITTHEGRVYRAYPDPALGWKVPTICDGHTGPDVKRGQVATDAMCNAWRSKDAAKAESAIKRCTPVKLYQYEYDALVSFTVNVGVGAYCSSTLAKKLNRGDYAGAAQEFPRWNKSGGRVLNGLVNRRAAEQRLFLTGAYE